MQHNCHYGVPMVRVPIVGVTRDERPRLAGIRADATMLPAARVLRGAVLGRMTSTAFRDMIRATRPVDGDPWAGCW